MKVEEGLRPPGPGKGGPDSCLSWSALGALQVNKFWNPAGMCVWRGTGGGCWGKQADSRLDSLNIKVFCS